MTTAWGTPVGTKRTTPRHQIYRRFDDLSGDHQTRRDRWRTLAELDDLVRSTAVVVLSSHHTVPRQTDSGLYWIQLYRSRPACRDIRCQAGTGIQETGSCGPQWWSQH